MAEGKRRTPESNVAEERRLNLEQQLARAERKLAAQEAELERLRDPCAIAGKHVCGPNAIGAEVEHLQAEIKRLREPGPCGHPVACYQTPEEARGYDGPWKCGKCGTENPPDGWNCTYGCHGEVLLGAKCLACTQEQEAVRTAVERERRRWLLSARDGGAS